MSNEFLHLHKKYSLLLYELLAMMRHRLYLFSYSGQPSALKCENKGDTEADVASGDGTYDQNLTHQSESESCFFFFFFLFPLR